MTTHVTISIDESTGNSLFLVNDLTRSLIYEESVIKRASFVEPSNPLLRLTFLLIRFTCGEDGTMGEWTRTWICQWRVNLGPVKGPVLAERWINRQDAIDAEVSWLEENFL